MQFVILGTMTISAVVLCICIYGIVFGKGLSSGLEDKDEM